MFWFAIDRALHQHKLALLQHIVWRPKKTFLKLLNFGGKKNKNVIHLPRLVRIGRGIEGYSRPRAQYLPIRTSLPVNNICVRELIQFFILNTFMVYNLLHLWLTFITFVVIVTFIVDYYIDGWYICGYNRFIWDSILLTPVKPQRLLGESTVLYFFDKGPQ